jgi:hypothetical protein
MPCIGSLARYVTPMVALFLMGCADGTTGADLVAPNDNTGPLRSCTVDGAGRRALAKCAEVTLHLTPGHDGVRRV